MKKCGRPIASLHGTPPAPVVVLDALEGVERSVGRLALLPVRVLVPVIAPAVLLRYGVVVVDHVDLELVEAVLNVHVLLLRLPASGCPAQVRVERPEVYDFEGTMHSELAIVQEGTVLRDSGDRIDDTKDPAKTFREEHRVGVGLHNPSVVLVCTLTANHLPQLDKHGGVERGIVLAASLGMEVHVDEFRLKMAELDNRVAEHRKPVASEDAEPMLELRLHHFRLVRPRHHERDAVERVLGGGLEAQTRILAADLLGSVDRQRPHLAGAGLPIIVDALALCTVVCATSLTCVESLIARVHLRVLQSVVVVFVKSALVVQPFLLRHEA
mmetsp:Transcript_20021/g.56851  ORF Transcript_20021/g.56851 Transcript_20021/m.56851 type:complete len:327 (-) Transcript_20021:933-1913(-)